MRNIKISIVKFFVLAITMLMLGTSYVMAQVSVSLPNVTKPSGSPDDMINVTVGNVTGQNITSYLFTITYNKNIAYLYGTDKVGTLSASDNGLVVVNADTANGTISVAYASSDVLVGSGTLLKIKVKYRNSGTTALTLSSFTFNAGTPTAVKTNGSITIPTIAVSFSDTTASVNDTILIPVHVTTLTSGNNIVSYLFTANYNAAVLKVIGVSTVGTLSAGSGASINANNTTGTAIIGWATSTAITGSGTLIYIRAVVIGAGTSVNSFSSFLFNNGTPVAGTVSGTITANAVSTFSISGVVTYANSSNPIMNATIVMTGGGIGTTTTNASGAYSFTGLTAGNYTISISKTTGWGGVNASDALLAQRYFLSLATLDSLQKLSGDVNNSGAVNNTDALAIVNRYVGISTSFTKPDWVFLPASSSVTISNANVTLNIKGQATGDVNASLVPLAKIISSLGSSVSGSLELQANQTFEVPVKLNGSVALGAASLQFTYPADVLEFKGVNSNLKFVYKDNDGIVTLAWADMTGGKNAAKINYNDVLASLVFTAKTNGSAAINLTAESELADESGNVYKGSVSLPSVNISSPTQFSLKQNYPNPFNPSTTIQYAVPEDGNISVTIYNVTGQEVTKLVNGFQNAGSYQVVWNASNLSSGIYFYKLNFESANRIYSDIKSMILLK